MIVRLYLAAAFLALMLLAVGVHYLGSDRAGIGEAIDRTAAVTGLASPALGVEWYEPRLRRFESAVNPAYPELLPIDRLSFVYGELNGK